jgi:glyoxylase I family protein
MAALQFAHIGLACKDPLAVERFYSQHFGFKRARVVSLGAEQVVFIKSGGVCLELFQAKGEAPVPPAGGAGPEYPGWRHLSFQVDDVKAKLQEMGEAAKVTLGPLRFDEFIPGWQTVWMSDPEGNIVEVSQGYVDEEHPPPLT